MRHNPSFKRPCGEPPNRSPSPPRSFVEPISPFRPSPIEPNYNYPPINNHIDFSVKPDNGYQATPKTEPPPRKQKKGHYRTPSTIDTLAEAALALSPAEPTYPRSSSVTFKAYEPKHSRALHHGQGASEPPHKRVRSELLPSPYIEQYASRPATSYEPVQHQQTHRSRFEEAELLLNFQSSARSHSRGSLPHLPPPAPRPHANSFPQDAHRVRPSEAVMQPRTPLLPPFEPKENADLVPVHASPPNGPSSVGPRRASEAPLHGGDIEMADAAPASAAQQSLASLQPPDHQSLSEGVSANAPDMAEANVTEIASDAKEAPEVVKGKRGWPKGKPRGTGAKKLVADKAATKKAASRKKSVNAKGKKAKADEAIDSPVEEHGARRKSLSDALVSGENTRDGSAQPPMRASSLPRGFSMIPRTGSSKPAKRKAKPQAETICAGCHNSKDSSVSRSDLDDWIACNGCKSWFHIDCAGFNKVHELRDVDKFFCGPCEPRHGKTTFVRKSTRAHASVDYAELQKGVLKTSEESMEHHYIQPIKDGTFTFDPETFPRMRPELVTRDFFERSGLFVEPICIPAAWNPRPWDEERAKSAADDDNMDVDSVIDTMKGLSPDEFEYEQVPDNGQDRLEMIMPQGLTVRHVCNLVGGDWPLDVIDVKTQNSGAKWNLNKWADYYEQTGGEKEIRNVISLEVSQTKLGKLLQRPKIVRDIDLQDDVWPQEELDKGKLPKVQFYCLMSVADSYTDFHIDFGGSSVYYHILEGSKTFFFIPPKPKHLKAYEEWNDSPQQNYTFLPSITNECYRVDLFKGDTMLIPSGWIHAVWTPADSLVIGGNFLNRLSYRNQFKVVDIEKANETPMKFRYPYFQKVMWYTAIKYLKTDPLPDAVRQMFYDGKRFDRELPVWADFDGELSQQDGRPGARNARFYSQAEVEGLPDLVNYIFRTVMLVMGRVEGISQDRMRRVNASIPKGHGEPLEVAKTFALWVAWKRGNEDPPAWAHPDAVLPNSKDDGPPKKLSERKLKELQKREAIAAWRIAPDRQSARVMNKNAAAAAAATDATANIANTTASPAPAQHPFHQPNGHFHQSPSYPDRSAQQSPSAPPSAFMMSSNQFLSTPKTSVLGPKRVACDSCRKRRIKCKHKDMVLEVTTPNGTTDANAAFQSQLASELHDNITVTTPQRRLQGAPPSSIPPDGQHFDGAGDGIGGGDTPYQQTDGLDGPLPGTNAYVNANIPMMQNGVPIWGEMPKRGRSKACYECRKSKRRCIHNESGEVDPVKAAENPVPRGSTVPKKRFSSENASPMLVQQKRPSPSVPADEFNGQQTPPQALMGHGVLKPQPFNPAYPTVEESRARSPKKSKPAAPESQPEPVQQHSQPAIDPSLFAISYSEPEQNVAYGGNQYAYRTHEQPQSYHMQQPQHQPPQQSYQIPSLEQIANEVLEMNGGEPGEVGPNGQQHLNTHDDSFHVFDHSNVAPMTNGFTKQEQSADSAIVLPGKCESTFAEQAIANGILSNLASEPSNPFSAPPSNDNVIFHELPPEPVAAIPQPSVEQNGDIPHTSPQRPKSHASNLPLYQPPKPLSQSPELTRRAPATNGGSASPGEQKRKRELSISGLPVKSPVMKKVRADGVDGVDEGEESRESRQREELARSLQADNLGLRRKSSKVE